jgi:hypothetical protein
MHYVWVDALCINQDDLTERGSQVHMMHRIYGTAEQAIAWLGPDFTGEGADVVATLEHITNADCTQDLDESLFDSKQKARWHAVACFFDREWFRRVWVRKEVAVAKKIVVMCGRDRIRWDTLSLAADLLTSARDSCRLRRHLPCDV